MTSTSAPLGLEDPLANARGEWQPIETAQKDSSARLVWCPDNLCIYCATWGYYWIGEREFHGWLVFGGGYRTALTPTHWMPLPEPPAAIPSRSDGPPESTPTSES